MIKAVIPQNYKRIDNFLSRSAQINKNNIEWLKRDGVTDVINFRTMTVPDISFNEKKCVLSKGMNYHNIPSVSKYPSEQNVGKFLNILEGIKQNGGRAHIHCKQGADRTGLYSYIYEMLNNIGSKAENITECINHHWHRGKYPTMLEWADKFIDGYTKKHSM